MSRTPFLIVLCLAAAACNPSSTPPPRAPLQPPPLISIAILDSTVQMDIRYATSNNFIGRPIDGYHGPDCLLSYEAANAVLKAQRLAHADGLSLKVYDCFRPTRAVADFVAWAADTTDVAMKSQYYPAVEKRHLFRDGYISERSGHSRGSTLDLTLVPIESHQPAATSGSFDCRAPRADRYPDNSLDMGSGYDCFDALSHTANPAIDSLAAANRLRLRRIMEDAGFANYDKEWWHYTLRNEPHPDSYFDRIVG